MSHTIINPYHIIDAFINLDAYRLVPVTVIIHNYHKLFYFWETCYDVSSHLFLFFFSWMKNWDNTEMGSLIFPQKGGRKGKTAVPRYWIVFSEYRKHLLPNFFFTDEKGYTFLIFVQFIFRILSLLCYRSLNFSCRSIFFVLLIILFAVPYSFLLLHILLLLLSHRLTVISSTLVW